MSKVSVLIAAYNSGNYLRKCLDSLLAQSHQDWQALCVDDASTDETLRILRQYAAADARIQVVALSQNGGQARARNVALAKAEGDYVCMLDSDDWFSPDALEKACAVLDAHPSTDAVLFQVDEIYESHVRRYPLPSFETMTGQEAFEASLTWDIHGLYMIRADIHRRFPYDDSSKAYSDDNTTRIHYLHSREVRQCAGVYCYRQHAASVTHQVSVRHFDYLRANESMRRQMEEAQVEQRLMDVYERVRWLNLVDTYLFYYSNRDALSAADRRYGLTEMKKVWGNIECHRLPMRLKCKLGYMPLRPFWFLFRLQEEIYFTLRKWMKRG